MPHVIDPDLTPGWCRIYEALRQGWRDFGIGASQSELAKATGFSMTTVHDAIKVLRRKGHITAPKHGARSAKPVDLERTISHNAATARMPWDEVADNPRIWDRVV